MYTCRKLNVSTWDNQASNSNSEKISMVTIREEVRTSNIQFLRWNEKLPRRAFTDCMGVLAFTFQNHFCLKVPGKSDRIEQPSWPLKFIPFHIHYLESRDSFRPMLQDLLLNTGYVLPESADSLATQISKYLSWNYRFPPESESFKRPPMTVIVVDVYRARIVELASTSEYEADLFADPDDLEDDGSRILDYDVFVSERGEKFLLENIKSSENPDLTESLRRYLGVCKRIPTYPIWLWEPVGLFEVKPKPILNLFQFSGSGGWSCSICLKEISGGVELAKTACCSAVFHENCIYQLLSTKFYCPLCRASCW